MQEVILRPEASKTYSETLAGYITNLFFKQFSPDVVHITKKAVLDLIGVAAVGSTTPWAKATIKVVKKLGGNDATYIGGSKKISAPHAALANGTMAHSHDYDDVHNSSATHPGAAVIPAALAAAESIGATGKELIEGIVAGYEVMIRLSEALSPESHYKRGFHPTATCGTFGATAAAGRVLGLKEKAMTDALGISGSSAAGLLEFLSDGAMTKRFHPGKAAQLGLMAALLAQQGFTGPKTVFEGRDGVLRAYSDNQVPNKLVNDLGKGYKILEDSFKPYACCRCCHSQIDAFLSILNDNNLKPDNISAITAKSNTWSARIVSEPKEKKYVPKEMLEAQMSLPYCLAVAAYTGKATLKEFEPKMIADVQVLEFARRVDPIVDPQLDDFNKTNPNSIPAIVEVTTKDGAFYSKRVDYALGDPENPMSWEDLRAKFVSNATCIFSKDRTANIEKTINKLEKLQNVSELTRLLSVKK